MMTQKKFMKKLIFFWLSLGLGLALTLLLPITVKAAPADNSPKVPSRAAANIKVVAEVPIPPSIFIVPTQPAEGRNPFFPQSTVQVVMVSKVTKENPIESFSFVLNGITSPPKRTAMINGRTFEAGEEGEVRMPSGGKILIKCEDIKADSAIINVGGQRRELRLRTGL
jgi:hypothetical protein